jgi:hypothetical protein
MNRPILMCALFAVTAAALGAQEASQNSPYEGTSNPPPDTSIVTPEPAQAKPPAGRRAYDSSSAQQPATDDDSSQPPQPREDAVPTSVDPSANFPNDTQAYQTRPVPRSQTPALSQRAYAADPDGDIVHPLPMRRGDVGAGATIRVRLMHRLSTSFSVQGEAFRTRVASDVLQGGQVVIPAGAEIDGQVVQVSKGHTGGHGTMRLRPETVILPNGTRCKLYAELTGTPGSSTKVGGEGTISPGSRMKRDGVEYGAVVGGGAVTGALLGGPVGALTGSLVGAGVVTVHLLRSHPQATLETGTLLQFTLTEPLHMTPVGDSISEN